jgi:hypothetical protein
VSQAVRDEAARGDKEAARRRLESVVDIPNLTMNEEIFEFAQVLMNEGVLPEKAGDDALHIAIAAVHEVDYLLTWNCRHIDNPHTKPQMRSICLRSGLGFPEICTPEELMGGIDNGR